MASRFVSTPEASRRFAAVYLERADGVAALLARGTPTLVHGDAHLGNMYLVDGTPGFLDWAMVSCAPGLRDVALDPDAEWEQYREQLVTGWSAAYPTNARFDPVAVRLPCAEAAG